MVSSPPELWESHARGYDMLQKDLIDVDGGVCTYAQLLEKTEGRFAQLASYQSSRERHERCQAAITRLAEIYATTRPDVAIIIGEDQHEQFSADYMPALLVHWGDYSPTKRATREQNSRYTILYAFTPRAQRPRLD